VGCFRVVESEGNFDQFKALFDEVVLVIRFKVLSEVLAAIHGLLHFIHLLHFAPFTNGVANVLSGKIVGFLLDYRIFRNVPAFLRQISLIFVECSKQINRLDILAKSSVESHHVMKEVAIPFVLNEEIRLVVSGCLEGSERRRIDISELFPVGQCK